MTENPIRLIKDKISDKGVRFLDFAQEGNVPDLDMVVVLFENILDNAPRPIYWSWMDKKTNIGHLSVAWKIEEKKAETKEIEEKEPWWVK
jgi:hypothetical protein